MQTANSLPDKLHHYINMADEQKLQATYVLLEGEIEEQAHIYSNEEIELFYERRRHHLAGQGKSYDVEESIRRTRQKPKA